MKCNFNFYTIIFKIICLTSQGKDEFIGECTVVPTVCLTSATSPALKWHKITRYTSPSGELLASCELILNDSGKLSCHDLRKAAPPNDHYYIVPTNIRPILQKMRVEVLFWGVRDMKRYQLLHVNSPLVEMECGGVKIQSEHIKNAKENPNFPNPSKFKTVVSFLLEIEFASGAPVGEWIYYV